MTDARDTPLGRRCDIDACLEPAVQTRLVGADENTAVELDLCSFHHFVMSSPFDVDE
jgi:hypothetical protein